MIQNMSIEDFLDVATTLRKDMSVRQLDAASIQFAQDKEVIGMILAMVDAMPEGFHKTVIEHLNKEYQ